MHIGPTEIIDTFAEGFGMRYARLIVTAVDPYWLDAALAETTGYASSVIACDAEAGVEQYLEPKETPDGRPGAAVLLFAFSMMLSKSLIFLDRVNNSAFANSINFSNETPPPINALLMTRLDISALCADSSMLRPLPLASM